MRNLLYLFRKLFGIIILIITLILICTIVFGRQATYLDYESYVIFVALVLLFLGIFIYPSRDKYCRCGRKYSDKKFEYVDTISSKTKVENNIKITSYAYKINIIYLCNHCNKEYKKSKVISGGKTIKNIETGDFIDNRISHADAINAFASKIKK